MKRKRLYVLLGAEFAALLILVLLTNEFPKLFSSLMAFPFEQSGAALRALSLSGQVGNGLALVIWAGISLSPLMSILRHKGEQSYKYESAALILLSIALFLVLYGMANPMMLCYAFPHMGDSALPVMKAIMGTAVWSITVLWVVLRLLRLFRAGDTNKLLGYLRAMLYTLCALFTGVIALSCGASLVSGLANAQRGPDGVMAVVRFLAAALPYTLDIAVTLSALTLLDALLSEKDCDVAKPADNLSKLCCISLGIVTASAAILNVFQLTFAQHLSDIAVTVDIPIMSLAFVLAALLAARLIAENRRLQNDNDLFI